MIVVVDKYGCVITSAANNNSITSVMKEAVKSYAETGNIKASIKQD